MEAALRSAYYLVCGKNPAVDALQRCGEVPIGVKPTLIWAALP